MTPHPRIRVYPRGGPELDPYIRDIRAFKHELQAADVHLEEFRTRVVEPISTLVISVIGAVASHYVVKCIDGLLRRQKATPEPAIRIIVEYNGESYDLSTQRSQLLERLDKTEDAKK